jgi:hypothetical protein
MRTKYNWGAKSRLANMEIGEVMRDNGEYYWRGLQSIACKLKKEFGGQWQFYHTPQGRFCMRLK